MSEFSFKEVRADLWPDFARLFGDNGACGGCWCQWWRTPKGKKIWEATKGNKAKKLTKKLIQSNEMTGLLAYDGNRAVGWCSYGPRDVFPRIIETKAYQYDENPNIWSINCFFIDKKYRGQGLSRAMLAASLDYIKKRGIDVIEAYPTPLSMAGKPQPAAFSYTGPLKIFEDEGFEIMQRQSHSRPLVRKEIG